LLHYLLYVNDVYAHTLYIEVMDMENMTNWKYVIDQGVLGNRIAGQNGNVVSVSGHTFQVRIAADNRERCGNMAGKEIWFVDGKRTSLKAAIEFLKNLPVVA
jgi:hypothetical protein